MNAPAIAIASKPTPPERQNLEHQADYNTISSLPEVWSLAAQRFGETVALHNPYAKPEVKLTFAQMWQHIQQFAAGLQALGVSAGDRVALFSENSSRWFVADQGIMTTGAVDVVRSSQAEQEELLYILKDSEATALVVENQDTLTKLDQHLHDLPIQLVILLSDQEPDTESELNILNFPQVLEQGKNHTFQPIEQTPDTLAALVYTSGTTGKPKGVMLSHGNLLHQVTSLGAIVQLEAGDRVLSILPPWHVYERAIEYFALSQGCTLVYTTLRHVKRDLNAQHPNYFVSVPRLLESIYETVQKQLSKESARKQRLVNILFSISDRYIKARRLVNGLSLEQQQPSGFQRLWARLQCLTLVLIHALADRFIYKKIREQIGANLKQTICGGGALAQKLDDFYEIIGIEVLEGYGLTETSPVLTARRSWHNLRGSAGKPILETEIRIVDPDTRETLPQGEKGLVWARGSQIMQGYYRNPEATDKVIDAEGWFNTEDLGWLTVQEDLVLTGRAKDTIVLSNGENVEPKPIENACMRSRYIDQIVVVGQDQRSLGALIVPNFDNLQGWAEQNQYHLQLPDEESASGEETIDLNSKPVQEFFRQEINREAKNRPGYNPNDRIGVFRLISEPFSQENGMLTQTLKVKRHIVREQYSDLIDEMFA
ncbi:AMP-dependent synthetase/ligase [Coleofasciculus sp. E1-EBD-02]|uniref:AMP-dependent synthetase/ligase n=1 Tax=Coleofasciculus sp. E1-EBD-02 TaxID=3068481 RepID=UPI0032FEC7C5